MFDESTDKPVSKWMGKRIIMHRNYLFRIILISASLCVLAVVGFSQGVEEIWVTKLQAETSNQLKIMVRVEKTEVKVGESFPILITVNNNGSKPIFLVRKEAPEITNKGGDIVISSPVPIPADKEEYDFSFHRIEPGGNYNGQIVIPGNIIQREEDLRISIGLGFVYDTNGIDRKLKPGEDPVRLRGPLIKRMEVVEMGDLRILVRPRRTDSD
ncbi:MAG TPA: hypothetical protein VJS44_22105 [Pyrinomonadaceae bacterium]|nr:hypothetical protein [Pyrinomonadaceae bacterium]